MHAFGIVRNLCSINYHEAKHMPNTMTRVRHRGFFDTAQMCSQGLLFF